MTAAHTKENAAIIPPKIIFRKGVFIPILCKSGYNIVLKSGINIRQDNGLMKCN